MQPLFLTSPVEFAKTAAQTQLPEDPNTWPHEILQELYKQAPYVADFAPHVVMEKVDGEQGYGLGHIEIANQTEIQTAATPEAMSAAGVRQVRVPIVIKDGMLAPFDLLVADDSKVLPLTEPRLRAAIFRPQAFDVTSRTPGDQSMIGQLYPPYRQSQGFGGGGGMTTSAGMGKEGASEQAFTDFLNSDEFARFEADAEKQWANDDRKAARGKPPKVKTAGRAANAGQGALNGSTIGNLVGGAIGAATHPGNRLEGAYRGGLAGTFGGAAVGAGAGALKKTAGAFEDFGNQFLDSSYLHAEPGSKQARAGKKVASGEARLGMLSEFVEKNASASGAVRSALAKGAATVGPQATKNTAAAKSHAAAAGTRAKNLVASMKKKASILEAILPTINESDLLAFKQAIVDPEIQPLLYKNASAITPSIELLMSAPERPKFAAHFASLVQPSVVQLKRVEDGYRVKTASHLFWEPITQTVDRGEAVARFGEKVVLAADLSGAVTMADGAEATEPEAPEHDSDMQGAQPVTQAGLYKVQTPEGQEAIGYVIPNLLDIDGTPIPLSLFTNGTQATVQSDVVGVPVEGEGVDLPSADVPSGRGVFASTEGGDIQATVPLTISASMAGIEEGEPTSYRAESFTGEDVLVSCQPNIQTVMGTEDGKMLVPAHWQWVPLGKAEEIVVESQEDGVGKTASLDRARASVDLVSGGGGTYSLRGHFVEKLAHDEREMLGIDDVMFLLAGLGVEQNYGVRKLAQAMTGQAPVQVRVGRTIKLAADEMSSAAERAQEVLLTLPHLRQNLFKEAAVLGDPTAVDTVLSLGFLNPENLMTFVSYLPTLEDGMTKLCDILLASRLGSLIDTPEGAIERSVRSTEAVLEGLKALAFQQN